ncbi:hypothetical protein CPB86DRAFT_686677, partial [Serendipita vermifera]
ISAVQHSLSSRERKNIKMFAISHRHKITQLLYSDLRSLFREELQLLTTYRLKTEVFKIAEWTSTRYECCENSCIAYTGIYKELQACPYCQSARHNSEGKPSTFYTLPLTPQLQALYSGHGDSRQAMKYTGEMLESHNSEILRDIHDAAAIQSLLHKRIVVEGVRQECCYFSDRRDIPLGLMTDGFQCFKR